ncbi:MAG: heme NO-binding domain-containing protein [Myxococcales bacterium]|nr:heme NO-binding domain-containing protein [Myxococcales bacterium]
MKGVVFTEFLEMVEDRFSPDMVDTIIEGAELGSGGVYTTLGTYDYGEMVRLVTQLAEATGAEVPALLHAFGVHLFGRFTVAHPHFFKEGSTAFEFLAGVNDYIHVEVRKLYADAELPVFEHDDSKPDTLVMLYRSSRPFGDLAEGLIQGCIKHFGEHIDVQRENLESEPKTVVRFTLTKKN